MEGRGRTRTSTFMTWTRLALLGIVVMAGCAPPDSQSPAYSRELSKELPKGDDTPLFEPPPNVLERDGEANAPKGG